MWRTKLEFKRSTQGTLDSTGCLYSQQPWLCYEEPEAKGEMWDFLQVHRRHHRWAGAKSTTRVVLT